MEGVNKSATILGLKEVTKFLEAGYRASRFSSVLCFTSATVAGAVLSGSLMDLGMVWLLIFSVFSTTFAFVINDLSDAELDRSAGVLRNPVSTGDLSLRGTISLALSFLLASLAALFSLSFHTSLLGLVTVFLYFTYSWIVRAKARPILDIVYHGSCPALLAIMGYTEYRPFNATCFLLASMVFSLSAVSQILQEVRDYETDGKMIKTTVTLLGKRRSLILCLAFCASAFIIFTLLFFYVVVPYQILLLSPLAYIIIIPIIRAVHNEDYVDRMLREIQEKRLVVNFSIIIVLLAALILKGI